MLLLVRPLLILSAAMLVMVACTRERPTPEPTATAGIQANEPATAAVEAQIVTNTPPPAGTSSEADIAVTNTPGPLTPGAAETTPEPTTPETFPYTVQPGDTLGSLALRFETDLATLRSLNNLSGDELAVGQLINVPYREGMTVEGMPTATPGPFQYTIQAGDTLSALAARYGVDSIAILEANAAVILDPNNLTVGTTIMIPGYQAPAESAADEAEEEDAEAQSQAVVHTVQSGQGLLGIAVIYGVSVADILAANGLSENDLLHVGQQLIIPGITARDIARNQGNIHIVRAGESLLSIALQYGITSEELEAANDLDDPDSIYIGQELIIPLP